MRDAGERVRRSVSDVQTTLVEGALLTVLVVFLFLNSWRSTVITGLALPVSVLAAFISVWAFGFTLNTMSLLGLSLAIGILIDDAIVVRENIVRHIEMGEGPHHGRVEGTDEIGLAVAATTFSIVAVFVPVAFMYGGVAGQWFKPFALTIACAVLVSLFVSFSLDPMLSAYWPDPQIERGRRAAPSRALGAFNHWFDRQADRYQRVVAWALDHRWRSCSASRRARSSARSSCRARSAAPASSPSRPQRGQPHRRDAPGLDPRVHPAKVEEATRSPRPPRGEVHLHHDRHADPEAPAWTRRSSTCGSRRRRSASSPRTSSGGPAPRAARVAGADVSVFTERLRRRVQADPARAARARRARARAVRRAGADDRAGAGRRGRGPLDARAEAGARGRAVNRGLAGLARRHRRPGRAVAAPGVRRPRRGRLGGSRPARPAT